MKIFKYKKIMSLAISVLFLMSVVSICKYIDAHKNRVIEDSPKSSSALKKDEISKENSKNMVGAWASYLDLNISSKENTEQKFIENFESAFRNATCTCTNDNSLCFCKHSAFCIITQCL